MDSKKNKKVKQITVPKIDADWMTREALKNGCSETEIARRAIAAARNGRVYK